MKPSPHGVNGKTTTESFDVTLEKYLPTNSRKLNQTLSKTILIDFDGVLRHWTGTEIHDAEHQLGIVKGTLLSTAFAQAYQDPVITGEITDNEWRQSVRTELHKQYCDLTCNVLMAAWENASWEIDHSFIQNIQTIAPNSSLVLVTNATTRLQQDLSNSGLENLFNLVVNSSAIGVAKPAPDFFKNALHSANVSASDAIFIDDTLENVEAAQSMGINSIQHANNKDTLAFIQAHYE